jgi:glutathione S-transferase
MDIVHTVIGLALLQFFVFGGLVGRARVKSGVEAPAMTGDPTFERYHRVHYNTMEQLVIFIPGMLLFGTYVSPLVASVLGVIYILGRIVYLRAYIAEPSSRGPGYGLTVLPIVVLLLGGLGAAGWSMISG